MKKIPPINMSRYTDHNFNSNSFDKYLLSSSYKKNIQKSHSIIKKKFLPNDPIIKSLYAEFMMTIHNGFANASILVASQLLEYMSKIELMKVTKSKEYPKIKWAKVLEELQKQNYDERKKLLLNLVDNIKDNYRNPYSHMNLVQFINRNLKTKHWIDNIHLTEEQEKRNKKITKLAQEKARGLFKLINSGKIPRGAIGEFCEKIEKLKEKPILKQEIRPVNYSFENLQDLRHEIHAGKYLHHTQAEAIKYLNLIVNAWIVEFYIFKK